MGIDQVGISMDFITRLPIVQGGYDSIMVIVDMLTKVAHLIPVKMTYTAVDIARIFIKYSEFMDYLKG